MASSQGAPPVSQVGRVCFASYEWFDGCIQSCRHAALVLGGDWAVLSKDGPLPPPVAACDLLVLSSWHASYEAIVATRSRVVIRWHSPLLQTELAREQVTLARVLELLDRGAIAALAVNDPAFVAVLGRSRVFYLPDTLASSDYEGVAAAPLKGVHVSLFGRAEARKNLLVQSAAFAAARRATGGTWMLHLNGQSIVDRAYVTWLDAARIPFLDHDWMPRVEYLSLVAAMQAGLCGTLSESYCYVAADHVALGTPIVASPAVACLGRDIARASPEDVHAVTDALIDAVSRRAEIAAQQRRSLFARADEHADLARAALVEIRRAAATA